MITYPILFVAKSQATSGTQMTWTSTSGEIESVCAIPVEFEGPGGGLSPEDLFAQALTNCFLATFKVFAEKSRIKYSNVSAAAELTVDIGDDKKPVMKECLLKVSIAGSEMPERVRMIAERAFQNGFILNSVKTILSLELDVR